MSTMPLAAEVVPTLAEAVEESLAAALAGRGAPCLWCGGAESVVVCSDIWSGQVVTRCTSCGSELNGVVPRYLREVPK